MSDKLQVGIPVITITIDGTSDAKIEDALEQCVVDTSLSLPSMAIVRIHDPDREWANGKAFAIGKPIVIKMAPSESMQKVDIGQVFTGEIVAIEPSFSAMGTGTLTIRAYDLSHRLHYGTRSFVYLSSTTSQVAGAVMDRGQKIPKGSVASDADSYDYLLQNNLSDYEFLSAHAKRTGNILAVVDGKLCFDKPDNLFAAGPKLTMGENLRQFSVRLSSALQAKEVKAVGWDFTTKKPIESAIPKPVLWHINGQNQPSGADFTSSAGMGTIGGYTLTSFAPRTQGEADALAKSASGDQEGKFAEADGVAYGHPKLVAGVKVDIDNVGDKYKGTYYVTSATHIYNTSGYEVHFTVSGRFPQTFNQLLNGTSSGPGEPGMISGVVIGIVTNNKDDKGLGRVKVRFPWLPSYKKSEGNPSTDDKPGIESNWARIAAPGAGVARGMYYLPEVEDEVLVAFEHGNPNLPYIIGGLWNPIDLPPEKNDEAVSQKVNHRMIVSRSGHKIVLDDEEGKESILIMDKTTKQSIFIDSTKNSITIKGDGDLLIDMKGNITIKSGMTIEIEATSDIKMKGINLSAEATGTYKVSATTELEMKSNGFANFESTTAAALKGPTLDIEASAGPASIQGKPIMLN